MTSTGGEVAADCRFQLSSEARFKPLAVAAIIGISLLALGAGVAFAESGEAPPATGSPMLVPPDASTDADLHSLFQEAAPAEIGPLTDPAAAEQLPHDELNRAEAEELFTSVFPSALQDAAEVFGDLEVQQFRSDHVAVVNGEDSADNSLLISLMPLRVEGSEGEKALVDLDLERLEERIEPANPLVPLEIPASLDEGISLPGTGVTVGLENAEGSRAASLISGEAAFYPNVVSDSDFVVVPTPVGFETFTQIRSAEAPLSQTYELSVPGGATLEATNDGGAIVEKDGDVLVAIRPPFGIDATGASVPVSMAVSGNSLSLHAMPSPEAQFPILIDPIFESYNWMNSNTNTGMYSDWRPASNNENIFSPRWIGVWNQTMHTGLTVQSYYGANTAGWQGNWNYFVPRYFTDYENPAVGERPTTFIRNMTLSQLYFLIEEDPGAPVRPHPFMLVGLWDANKGAFVSGGTHNSLEGAYNGVTINLPNPNEVTDVKNGGIALQSYESLSYKRQLFVGQATVELSDKDSPGFGELGSVSEWLSTQPGTSINYKVSDPGLGVRELRVVYPSARGGKGETITSLGCLGTASSPCPRTASKATQALAYDPSLMAQGENWVRIYGIDPIDHWSSVAESRIKVDRTPPEVALSGNLTEQSSAGTWLPEYTLKYDAKDGDEATATALTPMGSAGTGAGQLERPGGIAVDLNGNTWVTDSVNNKIVKYDKSGNVLLQLAVQGSANGQINGPRGIAIAPNGNVWIAEAGNRRLQQFTPSGTFVSKISLGESTEPWGLAVGPEGRIWVTDPPAHRIYRYNQDGSLVGINSVNSTTFPYGIDVDEFGNAWFAAQGPNEVVELASDASVKFRFGKEGTGNGEFRAPVDVAIAPSGNIFVSDEINSRVQVFKPDGSYMRQFGTAGAANNQFKELKGIEVGPENMLMVADSGNKRIAKWSHADRHNESGAVKVQVKVDGALVTTNAPGCATKNCAISSSWVLDADDYAVGLHKVEIIGTDGVNLASSKTLSVETHGDRTSPVISLSGSMTEQASIGTTRPRYGLKVSATDPGSFAERKSGVVSTTIKVDGKVVDSVSPGCPGGGCSITREWTLNSDSYAVGAHTVEVTSTDGAGRSSVKTLPINITRDSTPPEFSSLADFYSSPSGWVEQQLYDYGAVATDTNGYGVASVQLIIDGSVVNSSSASCPDGGCTMAFASGQTINVEEYAGGAHPAELIATDAAGNTRKRSWTINVDPDGHISTSEAADTLEAVEATSDAELLTSSALPESVFPFEAPGLAVDEGQFQSTDAPVPTTFSATPGASTTIHTAEGPVVVEPISVSEEATGHVLQNDTAALSSNTADEATADTVIRPIYDGAMVFQAIREPSAPQAFSWRISLQEDQELEAINDQTIQVWWEGTDRHPAFSITAVPAHDAVGTSVPTTLSLDSEDIITLTVHHQLGDPANAGASFVYPVVAGTGWKGGFETYAVEFPPGEVAAEEEEEVFSEISESAPEPAAASDAELAEPLASQSKGRIEHKHFRWIQCKFIDGFGPSKLKRPGGTCGNPFAGEEGADEVAFSYGLRGDYYRVLGEWAKHRGTPTEHIECAKKNNVGNWNTDASIEWHYFIDPAQKCLWWGKTKYGGGKFVTHGEHLSPYGEWNWGIGAPEDWEIRQKGLALYIWVTTSGYVGHHNTTCIDC